MNFTIRTWEAAKWWEENHEELERLEKMREDFCNLVDMEIHRMIVVFESYNREVG